MASRLRHLPATIFEVFMEIAAPEDSRSAFALVKYPEDYIDELHDVEALLDYAYHQSIPNAGELFLVESSLGRNKMECVVPDYTRLPRIPDNRNLTEYYNAVDEDIMIQVFASMLCERRIIFTSRKLSQLSSCVIAASNLIYPMHWQHIFVPVLPEHLSTFLQAPMPFLLGVPAPTLEKHLHEVDRNEVVVLDIDRKTFHSPYDDIGQLPSPVLATLKKNLASSNHLLGDGISRAFLRALVYLMGGYREGFQFPPGQAISFSEELFIRSRPSVYQVFLSEMLHFQIFNQFVTERLLLLQQGSAIQDEFEEECRNYSDVDFNKFKTQYNDWLVKNVKMMGGQQILKQITQVRNKGKEAFKDFRSKLSELKDYEAPSFKPPSPIQLPKSRPTLPPTVKKLFPKNKKYSRKSKEWHGGFDENSFETEVAEAATEDDSSTSGCEASAGSNELKPSNELISCNRQSENNLLDLGTSDINSVATNGHKGLRQVKSMELLSLDDEALSSSAVSFSSAVPAFASSQVYRAHNTPQTSVVYATLQHTRTRPSSAQLDARILQNTVAQHSLPGSPAHRYNGPQQSTTEQAALFAPGYGTGRMIYGLPMGAPPMVGLGPYRYPGVHGGFRSSQSLVDFSSQQQIAQRIPYAAQTATLPIPNMSLRSVPVASSGNNFLSAQQQQVNTAFSVSSISSQSNSSMSSYDRRSVDVLMIQPSNSNASTTKQLIDFGPCLQVTTANNESGNLQSLDDVIFDPLVTEHGVNYQRGTSPLPCVGLPPPSSPRNSRASPAFIKHASAPTAVIGGFQQATLSPPPRPPKPLVRSASPIANGQASVNELAAFNNPNHVITTFPSINCGAGPTTKPPSLPSPQAVAVAGQHTVNVANVLTRWEHFE